MDNRANKNAIKMVFLYYFWDVLANVDGQSILNVHATAMAELTKSTWPSGF